MDNHLTENTISAYHALGYDFYKRVLFHVPHSSRAIPDYTGFKTALIHDELDLVTDHGTDVIFNIPGVQRVVAPFSRVYCDVERFLDQREARLNALGRGFFYTHTDDGRLLREDTQDNWRFARNFYNSYHTDLERRVQKIFDAEGKCLIIDCHSFNDVPLQSEENQDPKRPDICLGTDSFHTPEWMMVSLAMKFESSGFSVAYNKPFSGTMVPLKFLNKNEHVQSIMVEVNKRVYLNEDLTLNYLRVYRLQKAISEFLFD